MLAVVEVTILLVVGPVVSLYGYNQSRVVGAAKIDGTHVWVRGVTPGAPDLTPPVSAKEPGCYRSPSRMGASGRITRKRLRRWDPVNRDR